MSNKRHTAKYDSRLLAKKFGTAYDRRTSAAAPPEDGPYRDLTNFDFQSELFGQYVSLERHGEHEKYGVITGDVKRHEKGKARTVRVIFHPQQWAVDRGVEDEDGCYDEQDQGIWVRDRDVQVWYRLDKPSVSYKSHFKALHLKASLALLLWNDLHGFRVDQPIQEKLRRCARGDENGRIRFGLKAEELTVANVVNAWPFIELHVLSDLEGTVGALPVLRASVESQRRYLSGEASAATMHRDPSEDLSAAHRAAPSVASSPPAAKSTKVRERMRARSVAPASTVPATLQSYFTSDGKPKTERLAQLIKILHTNREEDKAAIMAALVRHGTIAQLRTVASDGGIAAVFADLARRCQLGGFKVGEHVDNCVKFLAKCAAMKGKAITDAFTALPLEERKAFADVIQKGKNAIERKGKQNVSARVKRVVKAMITVQSRLPEVSASSPASSRPRALAKTEDPRIAAATEGRSRVKSKSRASAEDPEGAAKAPSPESPVPSSSGAQQRASESPTIPRRKAVKEAGSPAGDPRRTPKEDEIGQALRPVPRKKRQRLGPDWVWRREEEKRQREKARLVQAAVQLEPTGGTPTVLFASAGRDAPLTIAVPAGDLQAEIPRRKPKNRRPLPPGTKKRKTGTPRNLEIVQVGDSSDDDLEDFQTPTMESPYFPPTATAPYPPAPWPGTSSSGHYTYPPAPYAHASAVPDPPPLQLYAPGVPTPCLLVPRGPAPGAFHDDDDSDLSDMDATNPGAVADESDLSDMEPPLPPAPAQGIDLDSGSELSDLDIPEPGPLPVPPLAPLLPELPPRPAIPSPGGVDTLDDLSDLSSDDLSDLESGPPARQASVVSRAFPVTPSSEGQKPGEQSYDEGGRHAATVESSAPPRGAPQPAGPIEVLSDVDSEFSDLE